MNPLRNLNLKGIIKFAFALLTIFFVSCGGDDYTPVIGGDKDNTTNNNGGGGNTGGGSQSEGDGVYRKTRGRDEVTACIHFDPGSPGPIPPPTPPPEPGEDGIMLKPYEYYRTLRRW